MNFGTQMKRIETNNSLSLEIDEQADQISVKWLGRSGDREPSIFLKPIFEDLLSKNKKIIFDFKSLEFMNSSTVTPVIKVIDIIKSKEGEILIIFSKDTKWQELSFTAMEILKTDDGSIDVRGE